MRLGFCPETFAEVVKDLPKSDKKLLLEKYTQHAKVLE